MTQSDSLSPSITQTGNVTFVATNSQKNWTGLQCKTTYSTSASNWTVRCYRTVWWWSTWCCIVLLHGYLLRRDLCMRIISCLTDSSLFTWYWRRPHFNKEEFLPQAWKESTKSMKSLRLEIKTREVVGIESIVPFFIQMCDLRLRAWFGIVENLALDELIGTLFMSLCIWPILH